MSKTEYFCVGRIQTTRGVDKKCTFRSTDLEEGLSKMWEWAKQQPMRKRFVWPEYELEKGIYSYWKNER